MFTPIGEKSRVTRVTRRARLEVVEPAVPSLNGPPSYSYGSPTAALPTMSPTNKTPSSIAGAFNSAISMYNEDNALDNLTTSTNDEDTNSITSIRQNRTPRKSTPTLAEIEASVNRRRSLRSASRSVGASTTYTGSRSAASITDEDDDVSLEYDVTQSSPQGKIGEEVILSAQELRPQKSSQFEHIRPAVSNKSSTESPRDSGLYGKAIYQLGFFSFVLRRSCRWPLVTVSRWLNKACTAGRKHFFVWPLVLMCVLSLWLGLSSAVPRNAGRTVRHVYTAPSLPPQNFEEVVARLKFLEQSFADQWMSNTRLQEQKSQEYVTGLKEVRSTFDNVDEKVQNVATQLEDVLPQLSELKTHQRQTQEALRKLNQDLEQFSHTGNQSSMRLILPEGSTDVYEEELHLLKDKVSSFLASLNELETKIATLSSAENLQDQILQQLNISLEQAQVDDSDDVLKQRSQPLDLRSKIKNLVKRFIHMRDAHRTNAFEVDSFRTFIEKEVASHLHQTLEHNKANITGVPRDEFFRSLRDLETRLHSKLHLDEHECTPSNDASPDGTRYEIDSRLEATMQTIVQDAIRHYSLDTLARPDYASYTSGARINPFLTSATFLHRPAALLPRIMSKVFYNIGTVRSHAPAIAIHQSNAVGMCWSFPGHTGQLSVKLSAPVWLTDIAIEHVHPDIAHDVTSAPKEIEIWAQVTDGSAHNSQSYNNPDETEDYGSRAPDPSFVHVMDLTYNVYSESGSVQTFAAPRAHRSLNTPIKQIVYRVRSNWGNPEYTCIYRVRAMGLVGSTKDQDIRMDEDI